MQEEKRQHFDDYLSQQRNYPESTQWDALKRTSEWPKISVSWKMFSVALSGGVKNPAERWGGEYIPISQMPWSTQGFIVHLSLPLFLKILLKFLLLLQKHGKSPKAGLFSLALQIVVVFFCPGYCIVDPWLISVCTNLQKVAPLKYMLPDYPMLPPRGLVVSPPTFWRIVLVSSLSATSTLVIIHVVPSTST